MRRRTYYLLGGLAFIATLIAFAPASLLGRALSKTSDIALYRNQGSLWVGHGQLDYRNQPLGELSWRFEPSSLLHLNVGFHLELNAPAHHFSGSLIRSLKSTELLGDAVIRQASMDQILRAYDISAPGEILVKNLQLKFPDASGDSDTTDESASTEDRSGPAVRLPWITGEVHWSGGLVRYRLSGHDFQKQLPPIVGYIETDNGIPEMTTYLDTAQASDPVSSGTQDTPLILARLDNQGWLTLGITRAFTELAGQPWPGSEPSHAVVLEVQEKVF